MGICCQISDPFPAFAEGGAVVNVLAPSFGGVLAFLFLLLDFEIGFFGIFSKDCGVALRQCRLHRSRVSCSGPVKVLRRDVVFLALGEEFFFFAIVF